MEKRKVVIIGAGVAGLYLSKLLENEDINFVTLEKRMDLGTYGPRIINLDTLNKLKLPRKSLIRPIKKINFHSPDGSTLSKKGNKTRGYVVNLRDIENFLYESIKNKKNIRLNHNVVDFDLKEKTVKISDGSKIGFDLLIFATGVLGIKFRNKLKLSHPRNVFCFAVEVDGKKDITTIIDNDLAPGFYGWIIPLQEGLIEIGFGAEELNIRDHQEIKKRLYSLAHLGIYKNKKVRKLNGGFIPTGMIDKKSNMDWIVIGDAAGGEPMLGGSIHKCIDEADIAAKIIKENLNGTIFSLRKYEALWDETFGRDMESQRKVREMLDNTTNFEFNKIFHKLEGKEIKGEGLINDLFRGIMVNLE